MDKLNKKLMVTKSFLPPYEEYCKEIKDIWDSHWLTNMGLKYETLKKEIKKYLEVRNVSLYTNGHLALEAVINGLKLTGEVITTPFTFASTTHAITRCGLKPIFCDIENDYFTIDYTKIENLITEKTSAILPVHVYGNPCNVKEIERIAKKYNLKVIYDAAHTFGVKIGNIGIGSFGDVSMFSLHATKVYNSIEGGALTYKDDSYSELFRLQKNFGISGQESVIETGGNAKMNEFQAAMGILNLKYLDKEILKRKKIVERYRKNLTKIGGIRYLEDMKNVRHNYAYFPIVINEEIYGKNRNEVFEKLQGYNIFTRKYFFPLVTDFECYREQYKEVPLPNSKYISDRVLTLPLYGDLLLEEIDYICKALEENKKI